MNRKQKNIEKTPETDWNVVSTLINTSEQKRKVMTIHKKDKKDKKVAEQTRCKGLLLRWHN